VVRNGEKIRREDHIFLYIIKEKCNMEMTFIYTLSDIRGDKVVNKVILTSLILFKIVLHILFGYFLIYNIL
jgi:hypothetical protein